MRIIALLLLLSSILPSKGQITQEGEGRAFSFAIDGHESISDLEDLIQCSSSSTAIALNPQDITAPWVISPGSIGGQEPEFPVLATIVHTEVNGRPNRKALHSRMAYIRGGTFQMGSSKGMDNERPVHSVTVSDFYISRYELTFEEYDAYCEATGKNKPDDEGWGRAQRPVIYVSWNEVVAYCNWRSKQEWSSPKKLDR